MKTIIIILIKLFIRWFWYLFRYQQLWGHGKWWRLEWVSFYRPKILLTWFWF